MAWFRRRPAAVMLERDTPDRRMFWFGGRHHYANAPYVLPKDLGEVKRLDFQHFLLRNGLKGNYLAPVTQPSSILDMGCGTGRWAMEMATLFPNANVIGVDLVAANDVTLGFGVDRRPDNYVFVQGNVLEGLPFAAHTFDYVHQRLMIAALPVNNWQHEVNELARVTTPGGWVELAECGVPQNGGPGFMKLWGSWIEMCKRRGIDFTLGQTIGDKLTAAGLQHVQLRQVNFPMGAYGGRIGTTSATDCLATGKALRAGVTGLGIFSEAEYDRIYAQAEREFAQPHGKGFLPFYVACGQKRAQGG